MCVRVYSKQLGRSSIKIYRRGVFRGQRGMMRRKKKKEKRDNNSQDCMYPLVRYTNPHALYFLVTSCHCQAISGNYKPMHVKSLPVGYQKLSIRPSEITASHRSLTVLDSINISVVKDPTRYSKHSSNAHFDCFNAASVQQSRFTYLYNSSII